MAHVSSSPAAPVVPAASHESRPVWASGLEDAVVAHTALSDVDGIAGRLTINGHALEDIHDDFIAVAAALVARGADVDVDAAFGARFAAARAHAFDYVAASGAVADGDPMAQLASALAGIAFSDDVRDDDDAAHVGAVHGIVAALHRRGTGRARRAAPSAALSAGAWLAAACADVDDDNAGAALDRYLVTVVDHGLNASTFAARVTASTRASLRLCLVTGIATLAGPLHGGAPGPVLDLLDAVDARGLGVLADELAAGRRLMGFGHRLYRTRDPRAAVLEAAARTLSTSTSTSTSSSTRRRLALAHEVEREAGRLLARAHPDRPLQTNVEFFTAVLLDAIGLDRRFFSLFFACGRAAGFCAHVAEQRRVGKLIRPRSLPATD